MMIDKPGIYAGIADETYHGPGLCPEPALSSSLIKVLIGQSPRHAWTASADLNPQHVSDESERFDLGRAAHALLLEGEDRMVVVDAKDWRTKAAQEARDAARAAGKMPVLPHQRDDIYAMAQEASRSVILCAEVSDMLSTGKPEQTLIWREGQTWCRARPDWMATGLLCDYKTTDNASPDVWSRNKLVEMGYDIQAAWYLRGLKALTGKDADFVFLVQEIEPPYECSLVGVSAAMLELGRRKVDMGLALWEQCMRNGQWPGYPHAICWAEPQAWHETRFEERKAFNELLGGQA